MSESFEDRGINIKDAEIEWRITLCTPQLVARGGLCSGQRLTVRLPYHIQEGGTRHEDDLDAHAL